MIIPIEHLKALVSTEKTRKHTEIHIETGKVAGIPYILQKYTKRHGMYEALIRIHGRYEYYGKSAEKHTAIAIAAQKAIKYNGTTLNYVLDDEKIQKALEEHENSERWWEHTEIHGKAQKGTEHHVTA